MLRGFHGCDVAWQSLVRSQFPSRFLQISTNLRRSSLGGWYPAPVSLSHVLINFGERLPDVVVRTRQVDDHNSARRCREIAPVAIVANMTFKTEPLPKAQMLCLFWASQ